MKKLMMIGLVALLSACCAPMQSNMDCCKDMKSGHTCPTDGTPCPMECCKKMHDGGHRAMKH